MNQIRINKDNVLCGELEVPGSKSIIHRSIIAAALTKGKTIIRNVHLSDDLNATLNAISVLGAKFVYNNNEIEITGFESFKLDHEITIDCHESGSTLRFLIPIALLFNQKITFIGTKNLFLRPLYVYETLFLDNNCLFIRGDSSLTVRGSLDDFKKKIDGTVSSQFITGLLFYLPFRKEDTILKIKNLQSKPYVRLTIKVLEEAGIKIKYNDDMSKITVFGNQEYHFHDLNAFGDYSQAANFYTLKAMTNSDFSVLGLNENTAQGDKVIVDIIKNYLYFIQNGVFLDNNVQNLGLSINKKEKCIIIDIGETPDIGPILMVLLTKNGGYLKNYQRIIYKESNRVLAMTEELRKFGVVLKEKGKYLYIPKYNGDVLRGVIDSHNDHRIVMAMAIMGIAYNQEMVITNAFAINKSYPEFFNDLVKIGVKLIQDGK